MNVRRFAEQYLPAVIAITALFLATVTPVGAQPARDAESVTWTDPVLIATGLKNAAEPVLAFTRDGRGHAMWQADGFVYYAAQPPGQPWEHGKRLVSGTAPTMAVDAAGTLHALFANSFQGNYEIYHIILNSGVWSYPIPVSRTSGPSMQPVLVADKKQGLHAAWMDYVSGSWTIYIGAWLGTFWSSYPVSNADGKDPSLAVLLDGSVSLAWQRQVATIANPQGSFDIFSSEGHGGSWSLPVNVSARADGAAVDSTGVSTFAGPDGRVHLTWQEGDRDVVYDYGRGMYWPRAIVVGNSAVIARGPQLASDGEGMLNIAWDEGELVRVATAPAGSQTWLRTSTLYPPTGDQKDVTLGLTPSGLTVGWVQTNSDGFSSIYESRRMLYNTDDLSFKVHLPHIVR